MDIVATLLGEHHLSTYVETIKEKGYDNLPKLLWHADKDLEQVHVNVDMPCGRGHANIWTKYGHQVRLRKALAKACARTSPQVQLSQPVPWPTKKRREWFEDSVEDKAQKVAAAHAQAKRPMATHYAACGLSDAGLLAWSKDRVHA